MSVCIAARAVCIIYQAKYAATATVGEREKKKKKRRTGTGFKYKKMAQIQLPEKHICGYIKLSEIFVVLLPPVTGVWLCPPKAHQEEQRQWADGESNLASTLASVGPMASTVPDGELELKAHGEKSRMLLLYS